MKKVLILGSSGFLGSNIKNELEKRRFIIHNPSRKNLNLYSRSSIDKFIKKKINQKYDFLINCAAYIGGQSLMQSKPLDMFLNNIKILHNVIYLTRKILPKKIISIGSACAYPDLRKILTEKDLWNGRINSMVEGYGLIKKNDIAALTILKNQYNIDFNHYILANLYGPNDNFDLNTSHVLGALIYKVFQAKKNNLKLEIWGSGKPIRDFIYVEDAARIIVRSMSKNLEVVNLGSGNGITVKDLAKKICKISKFKNEFYFNKNYKDGVMMKVVSNKELEKNINIKLTSLESGLKKTIKWYQKKYL